MATGPEHYLEAQEWLTIAANVAGESVEERAIAAACAQAHATLALAAATALATTGVGEADLGEWTALICEPEPTDDEDGMAAAAQENAEQAAADPATEAFVDVANAEHYAMRDDYVNATDSERTTLAEQLRALGAEQAAQDAEADAFHAQRRADEAEANGEHVDYAEAEAVREIEREMAIEAGDDSELDRQVAEDDARFERAMWLANRDAESGS